MNLVLTPGKTSAPDFADALPSLAELVDASSNMTLPSGAVRLENVADSAPVRAEVEERCALWRVDHAFVPEGLRLAGFKLLVMDMDSTFITIECIDEIADLGGLKIEVAAITEAAMRGEITDFAESLRRRVALLRGLAASALDRVYDERLRLSPGAETLLAGVRRAGLKTLLVSGGFTFFTERLRERYRLDFGRANTLEIIEGKLTGRVSGPHGLYGPGSDIVDAEGKARTVREVCEQIGASPAQAIVIGDGANDLKMMELAGLSVAYHAKPVVRARAAQSIRYGGLDVLLDWFTDSASDNS